MGSELCENSLFSPSSAPPSSYSDGPQKEQMDCGGRIEDACILCDRYLPILPGKTKVAIPPPVGVIPASCTTASFNVPFSSPLQNTGCYYPVAFN